MLDHSVDEILYTPEVREGGRQGGREGGRGESGLMPFHQRGLSSCLLWVSWHSIGSVSRTALV
jgi:hypothetical protein